MYKKYLKIQINTNLTCDRKIYTTGLKLIQGMWGLKVGARLG